MQKNAGIVRWAAALVIGCVALPPLGAAKSTPPSGGGLSDNLSIEGQENVTFVSDPKLPGKFLYKVWAKTLKAAVQNGGTTFSGMGVSAVLFQKGTAAAKLTAPRVSGNSEAQTMRATGRVRILSLSLTQPGTTLDADTVIWHARTNTIEALGNVVYYDAKKGITLRGPRYRANTALKTIESVGPGQAKFQ